MYFFKLEKIRKKTYNLIKINTKYKKSKGNSEKVYFLSTKIGTSR